MKKHIEEALESLDNFAVQELEDERLQGVCGEVPNCVCGCGNESNCVCIEACNGVCPKPT